MIEEITHLLKKASIKAGIIDPFIKLEHPEDISHGDFSTNVAMVYTKVLKIAPKILAEKIVEEFNKDLPSTLSNATVAGPGFINIYVHNSAVTKNTTSVISLKENYGRSDIGGGKKIIVEYSSPNIAKPFTIGHLRSTIIGDAIANIYDFLGYKVIRDNHLGDWGTQFGKLLFAIDKWGDWDKIEKSDSPIKDLVALYVKFHDEALIDKSYEDQARNLFKILESGENSDITEKWRKCIELSKKEFSKIYDKLGVSFDTEFGESMFASPEKSNEILEILKSKNLLTTSENAQVVIFENEKYPPLIIQKSDGTTIYATRDLATDWYRKNTYGKDLMIVNEVGSEQTLYFRQLFEIERLLGWFEIGERIHVSHGLYRFKDGKMSTRKGNVIWLDDIIDEAEKRAVALNPESANDVAIGAIKFNDLKRDCAHDIVFDWDEIMNMTGDSGPYLQYACVRAEAVLDKAKEKGLKVDTSGTRPDIVSLDMLERYMMHFEEMLIFSANSFKPNILAGYLINLASFFNVFYAQTVIVDEKEEGTAYKLAVTQAFIYTMRNGLKLLGIKVPKRM